MEEPFAAITGSEHVRPGDGETVASAAVEWVVSPASAGQVAEVLAAARAHGLAVIARGGGSKLEQGNPCTAERVVLLDLGRLSGAIEIEADEGIATLGCGVRNADVAAATREKGLRTVLEPGFEGATVGGTIAADPPGCESSLDHRLRGDLLGLEVALPNGTLTRCGGRVVKNVTGFDLVRLYCGSFGTLGVVTSATLRVHPLPEVALVRSRECASFADAHAAACGLESARVGASGVALVPDGGLVRLLWRVEGGEDAQARVSRAPGDTADESAWEEVRLRVSRGPGPVSVRLGARPSDTPALCAALHEAGAAVRVALPGTGLAFADLAPAALAGLFERAAREQWLLFIERADDESRARFDAFGPAPDTLPLMRALKGRFDPDGVLAPGRFLGRI